MAHGGKACFFAGDLAEDAEEDQEVQQEPEDNEMEHREAADSDTMIGCVLSMWAASISDESACRVRPGVLPEDEGQQQEVTQEPGDIDIHAEEVGAATISGRGLSKTFCSANANWTD